MRRTNAEGELWFGQKCIVSGPTRSYPACQEASTTPRTRRHAGHTPARLPSLRRPASLSNRTTPPRGAASQPSLWCVLAASVVCSTSGTPALSRPGSGSGGSLSCLALPREASCSTSSTSRAQSRRRPSNSRARRARRGCRWSRPTMAGRRRSDSSSRTSGRCCCAAAAAAAPAGVSLRCSGGWTRCSALGPRRSREGRCLTACPARCPPPPSLPPRGAPTAPPSPPTRKPRRSQPRRGHAHGRAAA